MRARIGTLVVVVFVIAAFVWGHAAQSERGSLGGTIKDVSGAPLPGVTVEASGPMVATAVTDGRGTFLINNDPSKTGQADYRQASAGYFAAMRIPLLRGRTFDATDEVNAPNATVISHNARCKQQRSHWTCGVVVKRQLEHRVSQLVVGPCDSGRRWNDPDNRYERRQDRQLHHYGTCSAASAGPGRVGFRFALERDGRNRQHATVVGYDA